MKGPLLDDTGPASSLLLGLVQLLVFVSCSVLPSGSSSATSEPSMDTLPTATIETTTSSSPTHSTTRPEGEFAARVLVFHKTAGYRHASIGPALEVLEGIGEVEGFEIVSSEDAAVFAFDSLSQFDVIVFLNTTGDILSPEQQEVMERFIEAGGGFVGVHSAADTEYDWAWYGELIGSYFEDHPAPQQARVRVVADDHPVVAALPDDFEITDEWYNFDSHPSEGATVLVTVDESTFEGGSMGDDHPVAWAHDRLGGRSVYIGFGHDGEVFDQPVIRNLIRNALSWASGDGY